MKTATSRIAAADDDAPVRILLVDDDERNLLAISEVLGGLAEVVTATSGREALRHLLDGDFAVILLDVFMPGIDGYETAQLIRAREQTARIPIIFLSAVYKETEHLMRGYSMGAVDYVFKPVEPMVLKSKVTVFVDLYRMRQQVEAQGRAEQALRDKSFRTELDKLTLTKELHAAQQRQAAILAALPIALYEGRVGEDGAQLRRFVGGDVEGLTGLDPETLAADEGLFFAMVHPDDREGALACFGKSDRAMPSCEYRWVGPDGRTRHFLDQAAVLRGKGYKGVWAGTLIDVTEQKILETRMLQSGNLDALGQLTGGVAHDFNNLLASILGGIELLTRRMTFEGSEARVIDLMRHAAEQGAELVRRMMAFSRQQSLMPTTVDPTALREAVAGLVETTLGGTVELTWRFPGDVGHLFVDRAQTELALVNLILNARDAMPGGGTIEVALDAITLTDDGGELAPGDYLAISVSDNGCGIPEALIEKVTEPFFTTKEAGKGTGLGLSMVFGFVRQSGGAMRITSAPDQGTTIELVLPRHHGEVTAAEAPDDIMHPAHSVGSVLLIDDDASVRTIVAEQLIDLGVRVETAADGPSALAHLERSPGKYDLLLTDLAMPGMNGVETIARALTINPAQRVVLMTGYADETLLASIDPSIPLLRKPIVSAALAQALRDGEKGAALH
ncbi:MAG TPA: response regulator [Novosphingobium sp.]|nr:response regulator [Novosphingobium sp.]